VSDETLEAALQRKYYAQSAHSYDARHLDERDEHAFSLGVLVGLLEFLQVRSILDLGSGTGRALRYLNAHCPGVRIIGIEPVGELRQIGHAQGISVEQLIDGNATALAFADGEFDLVCEFGVLHHIKQPERAVSEMLRVAGRAIFISDSNNFGQGSTLNRALKQLINALGLWRAADWCKTRGRGYTITEGDGLAYSYSVFNNAAQIRAACNRVHIINTVPALGSNHYRQAAHVALLGIK